MGMGMAMGLGTAMVARFSPTASMSDWSPITSHTFRGSIGRYDVRLK